MKKAFEAPIPGQSLTGRPKNYPWERPPEITDPEVATQMHLMRLSDPKRLSTLFPVPKQEEEPMEETVVEEPPKRRGLMAREDM